MRFVLAQNWWSLVLRGLVAILVGIVTFLSPGITLGAMVFLFGGYALVDGVLSLAGAWRASREHERWGALLLEGIAGIIAAVVTVLMPGLTLFALIGIIAAWAILTGVFEIAAAVRLRKHISGEWLLALSGIASVVFGVLVLFAPIAGAVVIALWFGAYATVFGVMLIVLGFRLRSFNRTLGHGSSIPVPI